MEIDNLRRLVEKGSLDERKIFSTVKEMALYATTSSGARKVDVESLDTLFYTRFPEKSPLQQWLNRASTVGFGNPFELLKACEAHGVPGVKTFGDDIYMFDYVSDLGHFHESVRRDMESEDYDGRYDMGEIVLTDEEKELIKNVEASITDEDRIKFQREADVGESGTFYQKYHFLVKNGNKMQYKWLYEDEMLTLLGADQDADTTKVFEEFSKKSMEKDGGVELREKIDRIVDFSVTDIPKDLIMNHLEREAMENNGEHIPVINPIDREKVTSLGLIPLDGVRAIGELAEKAGGQAKDRLGLLGIAADIDEKIAPAKKDIDDCKLNKNDLIGMREALKSYAEQLRNASADLRAIDPTASNIVDKTSNNVVAMAEGIDVLRINNLKPEPEPNSPKGALKDVAPKVTDKADSSMEGGAGSDSPKASKKGSEKEKELKEAMQKMQAGGGGGGGGGLSLNLGAPLSAIKNLGGKSAKGREGLSKGAKELVDNLRTAPLIDKEMDSLFEHQEDFESALQDLADNHDSYSPEEISEKKEKIETSLGKYNESMDDMSKILDEGKLGRKKAASVREELKGLKEGNKKSEGLLSKVGMDEAAENLKTASKRLAEMIKKLLDKLLGRGKSKEAEASPSP